MPLDFSNQGEQVQQDQPDFSSGGTPMDFSSQGTPVSSPSLLRKVGDTAIDIGDFVTAAPGMVLSGLKDLGTRIGTIAAGASREEQDKAAAQAAQDIPQYLQAPVSYFLDKLGISKTDNPTIVAKGLDILTKGIEKGGDWVEKETGGLVTSGAFKSLTGYEMAAAAGYGTVKAGGGLVNKITAPKEVPAPIDDMFAKAADEVKPVETPQDFSGNGVIQPEAQQNLPFTGDIQGLERQKDMFTPQAQEHLDATSNQGDLFNKSQGAVQPVTTEAIVQNVEAKPIPEQSPIEQSAVQDSLTQDVEQKLQQSSLPQESKPTSISDEILAEHNRLLGDTQAQVNPDAGVGGKQGGAIGFKPDEPTLQDKAKTMSLEDWSKEAAKTYPQYADNPMIAAKVYDQLRPIEPIPKEINNVKQLVNEKIKDWDGQGNVDQRTVMQGTNTLEKLLPKEADRVALYDKIDQGTDTTSPGARLYRGLADTIWKRAADAGVVKSYVSDYITHMYDFGRQSKSDAMTALYRFADNLEVTRGAGMSTKSQFARERTFQTIKEAADKMGLKPLTTDVSKVYQAYATSMLKAVNNKRLIEELGTVKGKDGYSAIIDRPKDGTVPRGYTTVNHPQWIGKLVDTSIAPTLQSMFDNYNPHALTRIAHSVSIMAKTSIFSFSAFHPMSLVQALAGASRGTSPLTEGIKLYKEFKNSPGGDLVETLQRGGLEIGHPPIDLNPTVAQALVDTSSKFMDKIVPGLGWTTKAPYALAKGLQQIIFGQIQTTFKLGIASQEFARLTLKGIPERKAAEMASTFANDMQGGLNWRRIALDADTKLGSDLANFLASKQGQYHAQIWALAPDWTVATARSWLGAIRKGKDPAEKLMYTKYLAQSAVITALVMDSLNMHYSGRHFWQNDDPTTVDMGDGRKLQVNKHFMEGIHWLRDFDQTMLNKMGSVPSEFFAQAMNKEYLSNQGAPDIVKKQTQIQQLLEPKSKVQEIAGNTLKRVQHMGSRFVPITAQNVLAGTPEQALSGFAGLPIRGRTTEEKVNEKMQRLMGL